MDCGQQDILFSSFFFSMRCGWIGVEDHSGGTSQRRMTGKKIG